MPNSPTANFFGVSLESLAHALAIAATGGDQVQRRALIHPARCALADLPNEDARAIAADAEHVPADPQQYRNNT